MPQYFSPGVYVEEVDSGPRPIQGVSTSVTGAVGVTQRGPTSGKPELVTSFNEFVRKFGSFVKKPDAGTIAGGGWDDLKGEGGYWWLFAQSVKGFFDNGGQQLYVKRVYSKDAKAASTQFGKGVVSEVVQDAKQEADTLKLRHLIGIAKDKELKLINGKTKLEIAPSDGSDKYTVTAYNPTTHVVTLDKKVGDAVSAGRGDYVVVHPIRKSSEGVSLEFAAGAKGKWGDDVSVSVRPAVGATLTLRHDEGSDPVAVSTTLAKAVPDGGDEVEVADAGLRDGDTVLIQQSRYKLSDLAAPDPKKFKIAPAKPAGQTWDAGTGVRKLRKANVIEPVANRSGSATASGANRLYPGALVELDNGTEKEEFRVDSVDGNLINFSGKKTEKQYLEGDVLRLIEAEVSVRYTSNESVEAEENFVNLRVNNDDSPSSLTARINDRSALIDVKNTAGPVTSLDAFPIANDGGRQELSGGDDALTKLDVADFVGVDGGANNRTGIQALEDIDDISIVVVPGMWSPVVRAAMIQHCETMRYRFGVIDPPPGLSIEGIREYRAPIDTLYAALYYPWVRLRDPLTSQNIPVPPSGHLAGLYARVDTERGVHKAPANEIVRGILPANPATGIGGLFQDVTKREQDLLNPEGINALRFFPGRGQRVWGARTVSSDSNFRYINVRRIFNFIERSIDEGTQFVVFEPNDESLWARVRQTVGNFLNTQWRNGVLEGATAEDAYFVECNRGVTMTQDDIENGRLIAEVGIAPVFPAEFVIFRIQKFTAESKLA